ncbi:MAG: hypothetical protein ABL883_04605 [Terricaulis sp.]
MTDDVFLAELLGETPRALDARFRYDVLARVAQRRRRAAALTRALHWVVAGSVAGVIFALAGAYGMSFAAVQTLAACAGAILAAYAFSHGAVLAPNAALRLAAPLFGLRR